MRALALELSSSVGSIALSDETGVRDFRTFPADRKDSGYFFENLALACREDGGFDLIVVGLGPGSYAGIRIGIATALGLHKAFNARLLGLPSVCAVDCGEYLFLGDARRNSYVFAHIIDGRCVEGPLLTERETIHAKLRERNSVPVVATEPLPQFERIAVEHPSAARLIEIALRGDVDSDRPLEPIYLRAPYITTAGK